MDKRMDATDSTTATPARRLAWRLGFLAGTVCLLVFFSSAAVTMAKPPPGPAGPTGPTGATGATGAPGANGTNGTNGTNGANGANGTNGAQGNTGPTGTVAKCMPKGASETGVWSVHLSGVAGQPQQQADGVVSYPIPLCEEVATGKEPQLRQAYVSEVNAETPGSVPGCNGSTNEPLAEPGFLCVFRGGNFGSLEKEDKNAQFVTFHQPNGVGLGEVGLLGQLVVFRSTEFNEEAPIASLANPVSLTAEGSWQVTVKTK